MVYTGFLSYISIFHNLDLVEGMHHGRFPENEKKLKVGFTQELMICAIGTIHSILFFSCSFACNTIDESSALRFAWPRPLVW